MLFERDVLTFHRHPLVVVHDRNLSSQTMRSRTLGRIPVVVAEVGVVTDIAMVVEAASVRFPDYLTAGCTGWGAAVGFLYQRNS